jgi:hypothetical protein
VREFPSGSRPGRPTKQRRRVRARVARHPPALPLALRWKPRLGAQIRASAPSVRVGGRSRVSLRGHTRPSPNCRDFPFIGRPAADLVRQHIDKTDLTEPLAVTERCFERTKLHSRGSRDPRTSPRRSAAPVLPPPRDRGPLQAFELVVAGERIRAGREKKRPAPYWNAPGVPIVQVSKSAGRCACLGARTLFIHTACAQALVARTAPASTVSWRSRVSSRRATPAQ